MSDYIPDELVTKILERLPMKSVLRCTAVCKAWRALITTSGFNPICKTDFMLVRSYSDDCKEPQRLSLHYDDESFGEYSNISHPVPFNYRILGICKGLVCLSRDRFVDCDSTIFLWNPSIRRLIQIPPVRVKPGSSGPFPHVVGLGYDTQRNDYKIVWVSYRAPDCVHVKVHVYSLSSGTWRKIGGSPEVGPLTFIEEGEPQSYLDGIVHWVGYAKEDEIDINGDDQDTGDVCSRFIVTFNVSDEKFDEMEFPRALQEQDNQDVYTMVYQDNLALVVRNEKIFVIWVMTEYGVRESWRKLFKVDYGRFKALAGFRRNGTCIVHLRRGHLVSYDPTTKTVKNLGIRSSANSRISWVAESYTESIALFGSSQVTKATKRRRKTGVRAKKGGSTQGTKAPKRQKTGERARKA